jgi:hypothetical protein
MYNVILSHVFVIIVAVEKQLVLGFLSVPVAFVIQYAKHIVYIILSSVACPSLPYLSKLPHKRHDFGKRC